jgi:hypothetical protein
MDINAGAPVITRDEILIDAPVQTIWEIQTDVAGWPSWQPDVGSLRAWLANLKRTAEDRAGSR